MRYNIALMIFIATAVSGCSAIEPGKNSEPAPKENVAPVTLIKKEAVVPQVNKDPVSSTAIEVHFKSLSDTTFPLPDYEVTQISTDGEFYYLFGERSGSKFERTGKLVSLATISKELQNELPSDNEICYPFADDHALVVSTTQIGVIQGVDPSKITDNRELSFSTLPELNAEAKRTLIGIGNSYLIFVEGEEIAEYTYTDSKFELSNLMLPTFDQGETVVAAGKNKSVLWIATTTRLWALIDNSWRNRPIKYVGLVKVGPMALVFGGDSLDKWNTVSAAYVGENSIYLLADDISKMSNAADENIAVDGKKLNWAGDVRLLSDLYCVQCHTWAEKEVEWIKRLSDIQARMSPSALTEAKTMPQLNSVPAEKMTLEERNVMSKWLEQQKTGTP